jgi:hypothetical protein
MSWINGQLGFASWQWTGQTSLLTAASELALGFSQPSVPKFISSPTWLLRKYPICLSQSKMPEAAKLATFHVMLQLQIHKAVLPFPGLQAVLLN